MFKQLSKWVLCAFVVTSLSWMSCNNSDSNPTSIDLNDPSTFIGKYDMVSFTDKESGLTLEGGKSTTIDTLGVQATFETTMVLELKTTTYTMTTDTKITVLGQTTTEQDVETGTYIINNNTLTTTDTEDGEVTVSSITVSDNTTVTVEDSDSKIILRKR